MHCVKSVRIRSYSGPNERNADQNNTGYGHFSRSDDYVTIYPKKVEKKTVFWSNLRSMNFLLHETIWVFPKHFLNVLFPLRFFLIDLLGKKFRNFFSVCPHFSGLNKNMKNSA